MGNQPDNIALDWVRGEIQDTLQQGQQALEAFADNREDNTRLRFCLNHLHQVHGTLRMVELPGAALLAGEMESLAQALLNESLPLTDERISILMQGILRLPRYLDSLESSQDDFPLTLLPLLNELRAARNEPLLSDSHLFSPNLEPARFAVASSISQRLQDPDVLTLLGKLRQMYRFGLKGLVASEDSRAHLEYLDKVITRLIRLCQKTPSGELWLAAGAFVDSLQGGFNDLGAATTTLLKELEAQLSRLIDEPVDALQQPAPEPLLKNLLYYVARAADQDSPRVQTLVSRYHLRSALPDASAIASAREKASGPDREAIHSVVTALGEELARLKDQLDLFVRNRERHNRDLEELLPGLHQVANTLSLLSLSIPREVTLEQAERLEALIGSDAPADDGSLMDIAGALLYVESALYGLEQQDSTGGSSPRPDSPMGQQQLNEANTALLQESRNSLEQVKTAIVNFIASQWNTDEIRQVPDLLHSIRGALQLVPLEQAVSMLLSCERFVQEALLEGRFIPDLDQLDTLADAITSIEYYLERQSQGIRDNDTVLQLARDSLEVLGFPPGEESTWQPRDNSTKPSDTVTPDSTPKTADTELVDEEILAIFVEEAQEVLDSIDTHYPQFRDHPDDSASLRELRRAFHTLKGSGRLVSATSIGELSWAVENIFNRLLDNSLSVSTRMFELFDRVIERLPSLLQEFRDGHSNGDVTALIRDCHAMVDNPPAASDTSPDQATEDTPAPTPDAEPEPEAEAAEPPPASDDEPDELIDDEILEIFIEEAEEVLETIRDQLPQLLANYDNASALDQVRRAFHTLKGSGRMVKAGVIAELAWSLEHLLNRVIEKRLFMNPDIGELLQQVSDMIPALVEDFSQQRSASLDTQPLQERAAALARGEQPDIGEMPEDENPPALDRTPTKPGRDDQDQEQTDYEDAGTDPLLLDIFRSEAETHLTTLSRFIHQAKDRQRMAYSDDLSRALHTLKGSAHTAGITPIAAVATPIERYIKAARDQNLSADPDAIALLQRLLDFIHAGLDQLDSQPLAPLPGTDSFLAELEQYSQDTLEEGASQETPHNPLLELFNAEGIEHLLEANTVLSRWAEEPESESDGPAQLRQALQHLEEPALKREVHDLAELCHALWQLHQALALSGTGPDAETLAALRKGHDQLIDLLDQLAAGLGTQSDQETLQQLTSLTEAIEQKRSDAREKAFEEQFSGDLDNLDQQMDEDPSLENLSWQQDGSEEDPSVLAIFLEETNDLLSHAGELIENWQLDPDSSGLLQQLQQDLHTLREGARLAGQEHMEDLCATQEAVLSGLIDGYLQQQDPLPELLGRGHEALTLQLANIRQGQPPESATTLIEALEQYQQQAQQTVPVTQVPAEDAQTAAEARQGTPTEEADEAPQFEALDPEMVEIFLEEAQELILSTGEALHQWLSHPEDRALAATLQRDLHTLKGGARMAGVKPIGDLGHTLEDLFEKVVDGRLDASNQHSLLFACHDALATMVDQLSAGETVENPTALLQQVRALLSGKPPVPAHDDDTQSQLESEDLLELKDSPEGHEQEENPEDEEDLNAFFLEEARQIQENLSHYLSAWDSPQSLQPINQLQQSLQSLRGSARLASLEAIAQLAEGWDAQLNRVLEGHSEPQAIQTLSRRCLDTLGDMLDALEAGDAPHLPDDLWPDQTQDRPQSPEPENDLDPEVLAIFQEEAQELMDALENCLAQWRQDPAGEHNSQAQRLLHTLKGGARLAGLKDLGDKAHEFETLLMALPGEGPGEEDWKTINYQHDHIIALVESMLEAPQPQKQEPQPSSSPKSDSPADKNSASGQQDAQEKPAGKKGKKAAKGKSPATPPQPDTRAEDTQSRAGKKVAARARRKAEQTRAQQETVRVNAQLLEDLVNLAGETSITRSRMEQQISDFSHTLDEMSATTERLREQLRRMEIETETQILFRAEQDLGTHYDEDFDPLEMDRYSAIQQLSRALTESASDLTDLRETLSDKMRDAETLLLQQSRTNTELQEGLMKTRMTPFSAMVPRLRRIVRQITGELDKQAEFEVYNAEGEMDRTVLERMIAPLEHMLRNALDHGIESAADRRAAGKPETGHVSLSLSREGGEIVLRLQDDGAGISIERVREKALRQNMLGPDETLSDREVLQFILQPGFSTAAAVTQISGRGVGMDVVASEIKQVGGSLDIDSKVGEGTTFTVRLPFTVSVNRALMVTTGEDFYAIPLNTIEGIVRVSTWELEEFYQPDAPLYEYAGQHYRLQYLGALLNSEHQPKLQGQSLPLPVILVRGADQPMALQVDSLLGSREIVVKSLGPQFNTVRGVSGATILGDGNVVVILDLPAMIRADILSQRQRMLTQMGDQRSRREERPTLVMVVDDSVTVRKVTSRLLERNGMDVMLAKDGLDAVAQLQDHTPDVILLDIEMPRMDGFEVASFVRHDEHLCNVPIVMITSRTGDKHRERAMSIGVNEYLGKPFQEQELLETLLRTVRAEA